MQKNPCPDSLDATGRRAFQHGAVMAGAALLLSACAFKQPPSPEQVQARQAHMARVQQAQARFTELCKTAGITVNRRVTGVKGIRLERVPAQSHWSDWIDPMWPEAAFGAADGAAFLELLLMRRGVDPQTGQLTGNVTASLKDSVPGFEYLDVRQSDGSWKRHTLRLEGNGLDIVLSRPVREEDLSSYSISYELITDVADREFWIAGVEIFFTNIRTGERVGSIKKYVWDQGMGDHAGGRSAWIFANQNNLCPVVDNKVSWGALLISIEKVINPRGE